MQYNKRVLKKGLMGLLLGLISCTRVLAAENPDELYTRGRFAEAEQAYASASMDHPKDVRYRYNRGCAAYQNEDYQAASAAFSSGLRRAQDNEMRFKATYNLGNTAYKQRDFASAIAYYKRAIVYDPENEDVKYNFELALTELEELKQQEGEEPKKEPQEDIDQTDESGHQRETSTGRKDLDKPPEEGGVDGKASQDRSEQEKQSHADRHREEESEQKKGQRPEGAPKTEEESPQDLTGELTPLQALPQEEGGETPGSAVPTIDKKRAEALLDNIKEDRSRFLRLQVPEEKKYGVPSGRDW